jgi:hypothetical protein
MGAEGLEPSRLHQSTDFHSPAAFAAVTQVSPKNFENWTLSLPTSDDARVAPVESLHLPNQQLVS